MRLPPARRRWRCKAPLILAACCQFALALASPAEDRLVLNFNPHWKFLKADAAATNSNFNDASWTDVSTPHTYNDIDTFDDLSPGRMLGETNQWSGRTWYRKTFFLPAAMAGRKVFIEFAAVRQVAEVYLNGHCLGASKNGFVPFGFDLTPDIHFGRSNVLAVMCDNRFMISQIGGSHGPADTLAAYQERVNATLPDDVAACQADQIPWNNPQWHPPLGGIYRDVRLYITDPVHIGLPLYDFLQTTGPYAYATEISRRAAKIGLEVPVENESAKPANVELTAEIVDRKSRTVAVMHETKTIAAHGSNLFQLNTVLENPQLWEPDYPYLYRVVCQLRQNGRSLDSAEVPLGLRAVRWDVHTGFWINGHSLKLRGWGQRPTDAWPGLGTAQPDWLHFYTLRLMKEAGANFLRWGHCAGGPAMIAAADRLGLITDQPGVDGEGDTVGAPWKIRAAAFRDALVYYRNDPAILIWEGGNQKVSRAHAAELRQLFAQFDPHGGRAYAHRRADKTTGAFMDITIGTEGSHEVPRLPVVEGEYDREESPRRIWDDATPPTFGYPAARGQIYDLTSEQFAVNETTQYLKKLGAPGHCGGANWLFSDSTSGGRDTCEVDRASGEVDAVRLPKEAYYVCQTMFLNEPQVHIIGHWNYPAGTRKTVYVASNCGEVKLLVNNKSTGRGARINRFLYAFTNVSFEPGEITALAPGARDTIQTAGPPVALRLSAITGPGGFQADGSDVALLDAEVVDAAGRRCPTMQPAVHFDCQGPAIWRGGYNSGRPHSINRPDLDLECGVNRVAVRSTFVPGDIVVTVSSPGLKSATIHLASHAANGQLPALPDWPLPAAPPDWAALAAPVPPMTVVALGTASGAESFSYSGPASHVRLETSAAVGKRIYCDEADAFTDLPPELKGAEWVEAAESDSSYAAADLMQLSAPADGMIYVAFDARLPHPDWLARQFSPTPLQFSVRGKPMKIFNRPLRRGESLTLGANSDDPRATSNMYIVFLKEAAN